MNTTRTLNNYDVIQASKDAIVNLSAYAQMLNYERQNGELKGNETFYLQRTMGNSLDNAIPDIKEGLKFNGFNDHEIDGYISLLGNIPMFKLYRASASKMGGFTKNEVEKYVTEKVFSKKNEAEFKNALVEGLPFTFGINMNNVRMQQAEKSTYDFLMEGYLGVPTGATLFGSSEILNFLEFNGSPEDITNGATSIPTTSVRGSQELAPYKVIALRIPELTNEIATGVGYAGDNLIKSVFGQALQIAENKMKTTVMRNFYGALSNLKDNTGNPVVPTKTLSDIDNALNATSIKQLFSSSAGIGTFMTKVLPKLWAPDNGLLDANQNVLQKIVAPTSLYASYHNTIATLGFTGQTTGQVPANGNLDRMMTNLKWYFGGDILPDPTSKDVRLLLVSDPIFPEYKSPEYSAIWVSMALAPTVMAVSNSIGVTDQVFVSKFSDPVVTSPNRLLFLV